MIEIAVCTLDHRGLFAQLAGAIATCGASIVDAKAFTADDGFALDVFSIHDGEGAPLADEHRIARLGRIMARAAAGEKIGGPAATRRVGAPRAAAFQVRPRIEFDNEASAHATVIETQGQDRPGLLSDMARALFLEGLSISSALVATYGERALDVFYVRDAFGQKVTNFERIACIKNRLLAALSDSP